jgi:hypothetical protein
MPSSFSTDLRIELIATGEQSGTWGTTTNTNLGTIIEDAISGMAAITTITSPYTLTTVNGAADQARCAALQLATTTGANFTVNVPAVTKLYVVKNVDLTYSVTVKTASGSGIVVPAGRTALLRCDGINVVEQLDYIAGGLTLGSPMGVPSGGTGVSSRTAYSVLCGGTTSTGAFQSVSGLGTSGQVLTSNGAGALPTWQATPAFFASGTRLLFQQSSAPTGWTKVTTYNDVALRVVSGSVSTGGSVAFSTAFASKSVVGSVGSTTLATSEIPAHSHPQQRFSSTAGGSATPNVGANLQANPTTFIPNLDTANTGGGGSHSHSFSGTAINLAVQYVDVIIASKD